MESRRIFSFIVVMAMTLLCLSPNALALSAYQVKLDRATQGGRMYDGNNWDAKLIWKATLFTDSFRKAFIQRHIEVNHLSALEAARFTSEQQQQQKDEWEFVIVMYTKRDYKKFTANDEETFWKVLLTGASGNSIKPLEVRELQITPYLQVMFNHINRWCKVYRVTFPKEALGTKPQLTMQSVVGKSTLKWNFSRSRGEGEDPTANESIVTSF